MTEKQKSLAKFLDESTMEGGVDFHLHSDFSDGLQSPAEILSAAWKSGLRAVALTDHDTLGGIAEAVTEQEKQLRINSGADRTIFVAGIEISTHFAESEIHILAYFPDKPPAKMHEFISDLQLERKRRNHKMLEKMRQLGYKLSIPDPETENDKDVVWGRAHLARQLVREGYFISGNEAFEKLLSPGKPAYIPRRHFSARESLDIINEANGVAVLAHPYKYKFCPVSVNDEEGYQLLRSIFRDLRETGLHGIEAFHGMVSQEQAYLFYKIARDLDLIVTQGSDSHGKPDDTHHRPMYSRTSNLYRDYVLSRDKLTQ